MTFLRDRDVDVLEVMKEQLRKGYSIGDGNLCLITARDLEAVITQVEEMRAEIKRLRASDDDGPWFYHA